jgi:hypothetical protein
MNTEEAKRTDKTVEGGHRPNAAEIEPENRRLDQHPHQTAEVPYGSGDRPEPAGKGGMESHQPSERDSAKK